MFILICVLSVQISFYFTGDSNKTERLPKADTALRHMSASGSLPSYSLLTSRISSGHTSIFCFHFFLNLTTHLLKLQSSAEQTTDLIFYMRFTLSAISRIQSSAWGSEPIRSKNPWSRPSYKITSVFIPASVSRFTNSSLHILK